MATFLIRKRQLAHPLVFGTHWTTADCCLQQFLEPVKATGKTRGAKNAAASNISDLTPSKLNNIHHYVRATKKLVGLLHPICDTLARVLYNMHFYEASELKEVKQRGLQMSSFTAFSVCSIGDVPQQRDGASCGIMTVKFMEHLSAGISLDTIDP